MTDKWYLLAGALLSRCMYIVANVKDVMSRNPLFKGTPLGHHTRQHGFPVVYMSYRTVFYGRRKF